MKAASTKNKYLATAMTQPREWLEQCANDPSAYMTSTHVAIIRIALRRMKASGK